MRISVGARRTLLCVAVVLVACAGSSTPTSRERPGETGAAEGAAGRDDPERRAAVLHAFVAAVRQGELERAMELFADDAVVVGLGACKGDPCIGKAAIRADFVQQVMGFQLKVGDVAVKGNRVSAPWIARYGMEGLPRGATQGRGALRATVDRGRITRLESRYDLDDPETIRLRAHMNEIIFALNEPDGVRGSSFRVLLAHRGEAATAVVVQSAAPDLPAAMTASVREGTCAEPGRVAFELRRLVDGYSETTVPRHMDALLAADHSIEVLAADGRRAACASVPR